MKFFDTRTKEDRGEGKKNMGASDCMIQMPRFQFKTGRTDCSATTYKASKSEVSPSSGANGPMTVDFFRDNFGMTGEVRELADYVLLSLVYVFIKYLLHCTMHRGLSFFIG